MEKLTSREVDARLAELHGETVMEKMEFELDEELKALRTQAKNIAAHRSRGDVQEVLRIVLKDWIGQINKEQKYQFVRKNAANNQKPGGAKAEGQSPNLVRCQPKTTQVRRIVSLAIKIAGNQRSRYLPIINLK